MSIFSKAKVVTPLSDHRYRFNLDSDTIATMDYMQFSPVYVNEVAPKTKIKLSLNTFARLSPLTEPFFGDVNIVSRAFFVPLRVAWTPFNDFKEQTLTHADGASSLHNQVPYFTDANIIHMFRSHVSGGDALCSEVSSGEAFDLTLHSTFYTDAINVKLTNLGRRVLFILDSLGYRPNFGYNLTDEQLNVSFSCLPLFSFVKIFLDWFDNRSYENSNQIYDILSNDSLVLTTADLYTLLTFVTRVIYPSDYFTSAFDHPNGPNTNIPGININDPNFFYDNPHSKVSVIETNPVLRSYDNNGPYLQNVTDYILKTLHKVQDYFIRKQISGSRTLERYKSDFGVDLTPERLNRSLMFGKSVTPLYVSDVMQTSPDNFQGSSSSHGVGSYSGKGIFGKDGYDDLIDFEAEEFGFVFVVAYIQPKFLYADGRPRYVQHLSPFDFFTPEFDGLGNQAIRKDELIAGRHISTNSDYCSDSHIFGFTPRYAEYKNSDNNNRILGDFRLDSKNQLLKGWYLNRQYDYDHAAEWNLDSVHNYNFSLYNNLDFKNIFFSSYNLYDFDNFFVHFRFKVEHYAPMKPLYDFYDFDSDGREIVQQINGTNAVNS